MSNRIEVRIDRDGVVKINGMGDFPQEKPKFDVFFVMEGGEHSPYEQLLTGKMPDWVRVLDL